MKTCLIMNPPGEASLDIQVFNEPTLFAVLPGAVRVIVGPDHPSQRDE